MSAGKLLQVTNRTTATRSGRDEARSRPRPGDAQPVSYLVRFWLEPREKDGESSPLRGYARDLQTGEERYFGDPRRFAEHVLRRLRTERREETRGAAEGLAGAGNAAG